MRLPSIALAALGAAFVFVAAGQAASAATDAQLHACRSRVIAQYPGTLESNIGAYQVWEANGSVRIDWYNGPGRVGTCVIGPQNQLYEFIVNGQIVQGPGHPGAGSSGPTLQDFGDVPGVGHFAAVSNSGHFQNGIVLFQAYVNGAGPSQWGARCTDGRLLYANASGGVVRDSGHARYVVAYVCNGGPPQIMQNGLVDFGSVPNIGQFSVVSGSGRGDNGVVFFQAYVNGNGPQPWMTSCATGRLGQNGSYAPYSPQSQYVSSYICNGGPPAGMWAR